MSALKKCKSKITPLVKKCMKSKKCIDINKNNPLFLDRAGDALKGQPIHIKREYKKNVQEGSVFSYKVIKKTFDMDSTGLYEYMIGQTLNNLRGEINNFCYTFETPTPEKTILIEHIDGSSLSYEMKRDTKNLEKYHSIFLQVFLALHIAFSRFGFVHNDLHFENILITTFPEERWVDYPIRLMNKTFRVKTKYFPTIIDYGLSQVIDGNGKVVMDPDFSVYDLDRKYCIPIRDWVKLFFQYPEIGKILYGDDKRMSVIDIINPILEPTLNKSYAILPSLSKIKSLDIAMIKDARSVDTLNDFYHLHNGDVVNALLNTFNEKYPSKLIFRDCYFADFYQRIPSFVTDHTDHTNIFIKTYVRLLSNGDGFIDSPEASITTICDTLYDDMRDLLASPYKGFRQTNDAILRIQEKMAMIPIKHRGKFKTLEGPLQKHLRMVSNSIIKC